MANLYRFIDVENNEQYYTVQYRLKENFFRASCIHTPVPVISVPEQLTSTKSVHVIITYPLRTRIRPPFAIIKALGLAMRKNTDNNNVIASNIMLLMQKHVTSN